MPPEYSIPYPSRRSEAETHAEMWCRLIQRGHDARCEVKGTAPAGSRGARFDIVVFWREEAVCIVEVKRETSRGGARQQDRYSAEYGIPAFVCRGDFDAVMSQVEEAVTFARISSLPL
jgi:hypothetical protein